MEQHPQQGRDLTGKVIKAEEDYFAHGGNADLWKGYITGDEDSDRVLVRFSLYFFSILSAPEIRF
jgi:hypothetical protein